jgi:alpha-tubulin suppressor-like RCC1 family protein
MAPGLSEKIQVHNHARESVPGWILHYTRPLRRLWAMKRIMILFMKTSLCVTLITGGIVPVQARQPVSLFPQTLAAESKLYLPLVMKASTFKAISFSAGQYANCVLTEAGGIKCWGYNYYGQLGDGTKIDRSIPVDVAGLGSGVAAISTGYKHTCALTSLNAVNCWGDNTYGQLGNGTTTQSSNPVNVSGLSSGVGAISVGEFHACALTATGGVKCWGDNTFGQLGVGDVTMVSSSIPTTNGVKCWGDNSFGQLGDGTLLNRFAPVDVAGLSSGVSAIRTGGSHTCAKTTGSGLLCWGRNDYGQLGDGTAIGRKSPVNVVGLATGVGGVSAGPRHTCVLMQTGEARCWGFNFYGQLGDGTTSTRLAPVNVSVLSGGPGSIHVGYLHTCAVLQTGGVRCWGNNDFGQLGNASTTSSSLPVIVFGFP